MRASSFLLIGGLSSIAFLASACGSGANHNAATGTAGGTAGSANAGGAGGMTTTSQASVSSSSSSSGVVDAGPDTGAVSTTYPAPHAAPPQVAYSGGTVLAAPKFVPVFFGNENGTFQTELTDYLSKVGTTKYWAAATMEYGVGPASSATPVVLTEDAPPTTDDATIQMWLQTKLNGNDPLWPQPDANTIYVLHYPSGTSITLPDPMGGTSMSCVQFGGYHSETALDAAHMNQPVVYAVVPQCQLFGDLTGIDAVTGAESHELIEASTDPYPMTSPAYQQVDLPDIYWELILGGGEVGDMCAQFPTSFTKFSELNYTVQRTWSNKSAKAGHDPCVPELPGEVYFNSAPLLKDNISIGLQGQTIVMKGAKIPVGSSKTIELDLFSEADTGGPWTVNVIDGATLQGGGNTMTFSLDQTSGQNGQKLMLTINVLKATPYGADIFIVQSTLGTTTNWWLGLVGY
jgi:hypothetical protein